MLNTAGKVTLRARWRERIEETKTAQRETAAHSRLGGTRPHGSDGGGAAARPQRVTIRSPPQSPRGIVPSMGGRLRPSVELTQAPRFTPIRTEAHYHAQNAMDAAALERDRALFQLPPALQPPATPPHLQLGAALPHLTQTRSLPNLVRARNFHVPPPSSLMSRAGHKRAAIGSQHPPSQRFELRREQAVVQGSRKGRSASVVSYITEVDNGLPTLEELTRHVRDEMSPGEQQQQQRRRRRRRRHKPRDLDPERAISLLRDALRKSDLPLHAWHKRWDSGGTGELTPDQMAKGIEQLLGARLTLTEGAASKLFALFDADQSGTVSFAKFLERVNADLQAGAVKFALNGRTAGRALRRADDEEAFAQLDADASGMIDANELIAYYVSQGADKEEAEFLLHHIDANSDGKISRAEWREGLATVRELLNRRQSAKGGAGKSTLLSRLLLEAFVAPVKPPRTEMFLDLRPKGRYFNEPCRIERIEERAIMLSQMRKLFEHVERRCEKEGWQSSVPPKESANPEDNEAGGAASDVLTPRSVTFMDVASYVLKPATFFHRCSFVELLTETGGPKRPEWFVSHWWGSRVADVHGCLRQHANDRGLDPHSTKYWIYAYALNSWQFDEPPKDPTQQAFLRQGVRLSVGSRIKYDIYTVDENRGIPLGVTDGMAHVDKGSPSAQSQRQAKFPWQIISKALRVRIQDGAATVPADRRHVLNSIAGEELSLFDAPPPEQHANYHEVNQRLLHRILQLVMNVAFGHSPAEREKVVEAVMRLHGITSFGHCFFHRGHGAIRGMTEASLKEVLMAIPNTIAALDLVVPYPSLPMPTAPQIKFPNLSALRILNLSDSRFLKSLPEWVPALRTLKHLILQRCVRLMWLPKTLPDIFSTYKDIVLDLTGCTTLFFLSGGEGDVENEPPHEYRDEEFKVEEDDHEGDQAEGGTSTRFKRVVESNATFREMENLQIVRELLRRSEDAGTLSVTVRDGWGLRMEGTALQESSAARPMPDDDDDDF